MLRFWKEGVIVALAFFLFAACNDRDRALVEKGRAEQRVKQLDSALVINQTVMQKLDSALVHDTSDVAGLLQRVDTLYKYRTHYDTIYAASDSLHLQPLVPIPAAQVEVYDSLAPTCSRLKRDCGTLHAADLKQIDLLEQKLRVQPTIVVRSCTGPSVLWGAVGAGAGFLGGRLIR